MCVCVCVCVCVSVHVHARVIVDDNSHVLAKHYELLPSAVDDFANRNLIQAEFCSA